MITKNLDAFDPYWEADDELAYFVEDLKTRGIDIGEESAGKTKRPAISFSGFYSQGDGLAFDAAINWPVFLETHPEFKDKFPLTYLVVVANPSTIHWWTERYQRGNNMVSDWCTDGMIDYGFFEGEDYDDIEGMKGEESDRDEYLLQVCQNEADRMYEALEADYDASCKDQREQEIERLKAEYKEPLRKYLALMLLEGESFYRARGYDIVQDQDEIELADLDELGLIEYQRMENRTLKYSVTAKGKELLL